MISVIIHDIFANLTPLDMRSLLEPYFVELAATKREQLLSQLGAAVAPRYPFPLGGSAHGALMSDLSAEQRTMVQQTITNLMTHRVVLLKEEDGERALPIWIGSFEGDSIVAQVQRREFQRPLTYDLTTTLLQLGGVQVSRVAISRLHETVFYATLFVEVNGETAEVDCRPSDAISLAVRLNVPIYVAPEVMDQASMSPDENGRYPLIHEDGPQVEWYSLLN